MPFDEGVAERIREVFGYRTDIREKKMFGGLAFLHNGNMCCGVVHDTLMARVGPDGYEDALAHPHAREMDFTGKALRGFVYVDPAGFEEDEELNEWISLCEAFTSTLEPKE